MLQRKNSLFGSFANKLRWHGKLLATVMSNKEVADICPAISSVWKSRTSRCLLSLSPLHVSLLVFARAGDNAVSSRHRLSVPDLPSDSHQQLSSPRQTLLHLAYPVCPPASSIPLCPNASAVQCQRSHDQKIPQHQPTDYLQTRQSVAD